MYKCCILLEKAMNKQPSEVTKPPMIAYRRGDFLRQMITTIGHIKRLTLRPTQPTRATKEQNK